EPLSSTKIVKETLASPSMRSSPMRPQSARTPIGVTNSSEAMTPESRAMARRGILPLASVWTSADHAASYGALTSARYGGGDSGETYSPPQPASSPRVAPTARLLRRMVVDTTIGLDESPDPARVERRQGLDPRPRRERDRRLHVRQGRQDDLPV